MEHVNEELEDITHKLSSIQKANSNPNSASQEVVDEKPLAKTDSNIKVIKLKDEKSILNLINK